MRVSFNIASHFNTTYTKVALLAYPSNNVCLVVTLLISICSPTLKSYFNVILRSDCLNIYQNICLKRCLLRSIILYCNASKGVSVQKPIHNGHVSYQRVSQFVSYLPKHQCFTGNLCFVNTKHLVVVLVKNASLSPHGTSVIHRW